MIRALATLLAAFLAPTSGPVANPAIDADFPDPAVLRADDGYTYVYATQGNSANIQVARSRDGATWTQLGDALPVKPGWAAQTQEFWAPDVSAHGGRYYLYYSAKPDAALTDATRGLCLAVATADRPEGPFTDVGRPLQCGSGFVNIDPMAFDDPATGRRLLYWGSGFAPIKVRELAPDRVSFAAGSTAINLISPVATDSPGNYRRLVEGAWVTWHEGWYYLFFSGDNCCGPRVHYSVMVARARNATGPFMVRDDAGAPGGVILAAHGRWVGPGHNSVLRDDGGQDWILYHAVDARRPLITASDPQSTRRPMLIDRVVWRDGWPHVAGPSERARPIFSFRSPPRGHR